MTAKRLDAIGKEEWYMATAMLARRGARILTRKSELA